MPTESGSTFNRVADLYDAARPDYPNELIEHVVGSAALQPGDPILEVGCGTGQATNAFARRGFPVLALDPGPELIRVARQNLATFPKVEFATTSLEAWQPRRAAFKLVVAAQSWHWIAPNIAFAKAAEALVPGGFLAVFGNVPVGLSPSELEFEFERIYRHHTGAWGPPPEAWYLPSGPLAGMFGDSGHFQAVVHDSYSWSRTHSALSYADLARTKSYIQRLAPEIREALLAALAESIASQGGRVDERYEAHLYMAQRIA